MLLVRSEVEDMEKIIKEVQENLERMHMEMFVKYVDELLDKPIDNYMVDFIHVNKGEYVTLNGWEFECIVDELKLPKVVTIDYLINLWDKKELKFIEKY